MRKSLNVSNQHFSLQHKMKNKNATKAEHRDSRTEEG